MKKIAVAVLGILVVAAIMIYAMIASGNPNLGIIRDDSGAYVISTSSNGFFPKFNAQHVENTSHLDFIVHDTVDIQFLCKKCGYSESSDITAPFAKEFYCDCVTQEHADDHFSITLLDNSNIRTISHEQ